MMPTYLSLIDTTTGGNRCDVTPIFADFLAFRQLVADITAPFETQACDYVAGIDALGFILGTAVAVSMRKGFIPIRKGGKLPGAAERIAFVDYTQQEKALELRTGTLQPGKRVLLIDEWIETGAQIEAALQLLEAQGGIIIGIASIHMELNAQTDALRKRYACHTVWHMP